MTAGSHDAALRTQLIGREAEVAKIIGLFKHAETGRGAAALVVGLGGLGKSRLVAEVSSRTASMGALVVATQSSTFDSGVPFALLSGLIDDLPSEMPGDVALVVDEIRSEVGRSANDESRRRNSVVSLADRLLREITARSPLVIVADDLNLADDDSLAMLTRLSRTISRTRTLLLGTTRVHGAYVSESVRNLIAFLERADQGVVIDLPAWDMSDTRSVLREVLGIMPDDDLTSFVHESSGGNPFFTFEVMRSLLRSDRIRKTSLRAHLADGKRIPQLRTSLIHRFFEVGSADTQVARVLSAFGRIELGRLTAIAAVSGIEEDQVRACFDRLVSAGLLQQDDRNGFTFTHSSLREALYDDIGPAEQRRLHRSIATHLMEQRDAGVDVDISNLASHVAAYAERGDRHAFAVLVEAGQRVAPVAPLVAASWFERAANLTDENSPESVVLAAERAHALFRASRPVESIGIAKMALMGLGPGRLRDRTISDIVNSLYISGDIEGAISFVESQGEISRLPLSIQAQYEHFRAQLGSTQTGRCDHFVDFEPALGTQEMVTFAHDLLHAAIIDRSDVVKKGIATVESLRPIASDSAVLATDSFLAMVHLTYEDIEATRAVVDRASSAKIGGSSLSLSALLETVACIIKFVNGQWDEAVSYGDELLWQMESQGIGVVESYLRSSLCQIHVERGDIRSARELASAMFTPSHGMKPSVESAIARVERAGGHPEKGIERLEGLREIRRSLPITQHGHLILEELANCYEAAGLMEETVAIVDELRSDWADSPYTYIRCRAGLIYGSIRRDVEYLEMANEVGERMGYPFEVGRSRLVLAECGVDSRVNFEKARDVFDGLGAVPWRQQAMAGLRRLGVSVSRVPKSDVDGLTDAESAIAKLVTQGMTNKEIAASLHYSVKTVEVYLTRIYAKTCTSSRLDLARAVDRGAVKLR